MPQTHLWLDLRQQIPSRMPYMIVRKSGHGKIAMIVSILPPQIDFSFPFRCFDKILGE